MVNKGVDIAPPVTGPPLKNVVIAPQEGVDDCQGVEGDDRADEDNCRKLPVVIHFLERYPAADVSQGGESYPKDEVCCQIWVGKRCRRGVWHCDGSACHQHVGNWSHIASVEKANSPQELVIICSL